MEQGCTRILLVEDNPGDARLLQAFLAEVGASRFELTHVETLGDGLKRLVEQQFDVILLDLSLPDSHGLDTVARMHQAASDKPIVVLTGLNDEVVALEAVRKGAQDYLVKGQIDSTLLLRAMRYAIERKRINIELEKLNELKNQLLGMAAHDLRNPLAVVKTCSDFLLEPVGQNLPAEKKTDFMRRIKRNADFMLKLIDDLLDVSRIESGKLVLDLKPVDITALIKRNIEMNGMLARGKEIELSFRHNGPVPRVQADGARLEQVLNNLISNAIKFSESGTSIDVGVRTENSNLVISVRDQGQGIPADELDKLFKPFARTSVRSTAGERSTGLGLAISRKIVQAHQGRIWAESGVSKGSTFHFAIPVACGPDPRGNCTGRD